MILNQINGRFNDFATSSFITTQQLIQLLEKRNEFKDELIQVFDVNEDELSVLKIGNAKNLIDALVSIDSQCEKIDIVAKMKDIYLSTMLTDEKAIFEIFNITDNFILMKNGSDLLNVETRYSAKTDLLDYYNFSKFANYCRDQDFGDLIVSIKDYLGLKNADNEETRGLRLIYKNDENRFYLRAVTSSDGYRDFGINFSIFVALISLARYVDRTGNEIYIDEYSVTESDIYVSLALKNEFQIDDNVSLCFNLILENDEIKRNAVSFNGIFKLKYADNGRESEIYIKPKGLKKEGVHHPVDLLTYSHRGNVDNVLEKIQALPTLIDSFITQVSEDAVRISNIQNPNDIKLFISEKVKYARKAEFQVYKGIIYNKLINITVDNTFKLFELLREVEDLFEHDDIISRDFWRTKLYEVLIERK